MRLKSIPFAILLVTLVASFASGQSRQPNPAESIKRGNARYSKAEYLAAMGEYRRVMPDAGEAYSQALFNIGVCYYELWRTEDAVAMYNQALAVRSGRYPKASYALGVALEELERQDEAKEAYRQAVVASPSRETGAAHFRLGLLLASEGDYGKAATHFTEALTRESSSAGHNNLGVVLALDGRLYEAEREFEAALKQAGGVFADATNNLKLCRFLLRTSATGELSSMKLVATTSAPGKIDSK